VREIGAACLLLAAIAAAAPVPKKSSPRPISPPLDFSGLWKLDASASRSVSPHMSEAVLSVTQNGNRIWISPGAEMRRGAIMAEEIVADGRAYEKALGPGGKGTVTADWTKDRQSLWIEVHAGTEGDPDHSALQRSVWKLSADRNTWVRESVSIGPGESRRSLLVFRRIPAPSPTPSPTRSARPPRKR